jgi:hypothetical protein
VQQGHTEHQLGCSNLGNQFYKPSSYFPPHTT